LANVKLFPESETTGNSEDSVVDPQTEPSQAVIVAVPPESVIAVPWLVVSFVMLATV
jgi:hypothetical protein